ncbi:hypothetical protein [Allomuricauda sp. SCSIO 65647]|uniref:hypothetical protein n=1 Tax=Allomuricauda sp. SCSIO 65647 TaxID=2908843 RepID=UPI001F442291|nr:hypothetical protein [Muricauda sp. SCSIO 65647]UJH67334.1 hypothetical protein L0P89_15465 [Muricauda sp. SCSIO 65647]
MDSEIHGLLILADGMYAVKAKSDQNILDGVVFTDTGNFNFSGKSFEGGISIQAQNLNYIYYKTSNEHELDLVDLTPYFKEGAQQTEEQTAGNKKEYSNKQQQLHDYIAGGQLAIYQRTSYLNDSRASSLTFYNFCHDGRFSYNHDGGFSVESDYGNAHGASKVKNHGTWTIDMVQGKPVITLLFTDGHKVVNPIDEAALYKGKYRVGNTEYAFARNKVQCR